MSIALPTANREKEVREQDFWYGFFEYSVLALHGIIVYIPAVKRVERLGGLRTKCRYIPRSAFLIETRLSCIFFLLLLFWI